MIPTVTLETKVWDGDWELILKTSRLRNLINLCNYKFKEKIIYINNVKDIEQVEYYAHKLVNNGTITKYIRVQDWEEETLDFFDLTREQLGVGYYYSIAELVSIYLSKTDYLLHFSGDSIPSTDCPKDWLKAGIDTLISNPKVKVFNLTWNRQKKMAQKESIFEDNINYYGYGFSDQMYLIKTRDFRKKIYKFNHLASERYPKYGGELFEKRVDSWMRCKKFLRATYINGNYEHKNFVRNPLKKIISIYLNKPNLFKKN